MTFSYQIKNSEGEILAQASEEVSEQFTMFDFLRKTIPSWEAVIKAFYDKKDGEYVPRFKELQ